jgi:hypothetical protein
MLGFNVGLSTHPFQVQLFVPALVPPIITGRIRYGNGPGMFNLTCVASDGSHWTKPTPFADFLIGFAFMGFYFLAASLA